MNGLARVVLIGNLTRDPELRSTSSDTSVAQLSVAVNERVKSGGEWGDRVSFFDVTVWAGQAENVAKYLSKGSPVAIDGRLTQDRWEHEGQKRSAVKVVAETVTFLPSGERRDDPGGHRFVPETPQADPESMGATANEDDIPFARPRIPDRETRRRDLFVGDRRWVL